MGDVQLLQDIADAHYQFSAILYQCIAAAAARAENVVRQGKYIAALLIGMGHCVHGAALFRASATSTPSDIPLMMRFRCGKFFAKGAVPMGISVMIAPL